MADNKISKLRKMLMEGCILEVYGSKDFFKVYPIPSIDKVKFSFAKIGGGGKGFDVYVDTMAFTRLTDSILNGSLFESIKKEASQYPTTWNYVTGKDGVKELHFGKSQKGGAVIQGVDKTQKDKTEQRKMLPLSFDNLWEMAKLYQIVMGLIPVAGYYEGLRIVFEEAASNASGYYKNITTDEQDVSKNTEDTASLPESRPASSKETQTDSSSSKTLRQRGKLVVKQVADISKGFACQVEGGGNLVFLSDYYDKKDEATVERFKSTALKQKSTSLVCSFVKKNKDYYFISF